MRNEFTEVIRKFNKLPALTQTRAITDATENHINPTIEGYIKDLCTIDNMGRMTATEVIFKLGIKLQYG